MFADSPDIRRLDPKIENFAGSTWWTPHCRHQPRPPRPPISLCPVIGSRETVLSCSVLLLVAEKLSLYSPLVTLSCHWHQRLRYAFRVFIRRPLKSTCTYIPQCLVCFSLVPQFPTFICRGYCPAIGAVSLSIELESRLRRVLRLPKCE